MDHDRLEAEVDNNYEAFMTVLPHLLSMHRGDYALLRDCQVIGTFPDASDALKAGRSAYLDGIYSVQHITDRPVDLGFFSHAVDPRIA